MINRINNIIRQRQNAVSNSRRRQNKQNYLEQNENLQSNQESTPHRNPLISNKK
jgi:hypothetical protein